jgi:hypothetical protein
MVRKNKPDSSTDDTVAIPRDSAGNTPPLYTTNSPHVRTNFGTTDDDAHLRPTVEIPGGVVSGPPQPRSDGRR